MTVSSLSHHTLIIPTFNRPEFLERLVVYYAKRVPELPLLVLDSSHPEIADRNAATLAGLGANLRRMTYPSTMPMIQKLAQGLQSVETPTVSFCADDDLVFPEGLRAAIRFLGEHADFVSAHGLYLNFREDGRTVHLAFEYSGPGNDAAHPLARVYALMARYESLFYGLFRTADLRDIVHGAAVLPTLHYQELYQSVAALIKGKVHRLPLIYAARQSCSPADPERDKWQTHYWFADDPRQFVGEYQTYIEHVGEFYRTHAKEAELTQSDFFKIMDVVHAAYFAKEFDPEYYWSQMARHWPDDRSKFTLTKATWRETDSRHLTGILLKDLPWTASARLVLALRRWLPTAADTGSDALGLVHRAWSQRLGRREREQDGWKYRLPIELHWLPATPQFQAAWGELRGFLNGKAGQVSRAPAAPDTIS